MIDSGHTPLEGNGHDATQYRTSSGGHLSPYETGRQMMYWIGVGDTDDHPVHRVENSGPRNGS